MRYKISLITLLACSSLGGEPLTLVKAYNLAIKNNTKLQTTYQKQKIKEEQIDQAKGVFLPTIYATAIHNRYFDSKTTNTSYKDAPTTYNSASYELKITQPLYDGLLFSSYDKSKLAAQIAQLEFYTHIQELTIEIATKYYSILASKEKLAVDEMKYATLEKQKNEIQKKFDLGEATIQDLSDTESKFELAKSQKIETLLTLEITIAELEELIGEEIAKEDILKNDTNEDFEPFGGDFENDLEEAYTKNLTIASKLLEVVYARLETKSLQTEHYPKLDLIGSYSHQDMEDGITSNEYKSYQKYAGLQLTAPLYKGGIPTSKIKEAKEKEKLTKVEFESKKRELRSALFKEYKTAQTLKEQYKAQKSAQKSAQITLEAAKIGFDLGTRTHYEVLQAIEHFYGIQNTIFEIKYKYKMIVLKYKLLQGTLSLEDLRE